MSIGTLSRRSLRSVLSQVLTEALPGVEQVAHIKLRSAPQGIQDRGFALEGFRSRDEASRNRRDTHILKRYDCSLRYAHRLTCDFDEDRSEAEDDVDAVERAIRNSTAPLTAEYDCVEWSTSDDVDPSGEWIIIDIAFAVLVQFRLRDPAAAAEALE